MKTEKETNFHSKVNRKVCNRVIRIIILMELALVLPVHIIEAQNKVDIKLKKLEVKNPNLDLLDSSLLLDLTSQVKIRINENTVEIGLGSGVVKKLSKAEIETTLGKDSLQNNLENLPQNDQETQVDYHVYDNTLLVVNLFLKSKESEYRECVNTQIINKEGNIIPLIYNDLINFKSFSDGSFAATKDNRDVLDTIFFFSKNGVLINTAILPPWSNLEVDNMSSVLKAYNVEGDLSLFSSTGEVILSRSLKNILNSDLFDFYISPDSSDIYISTFLSNELIRYSLADDKIVWRIRSQRIKKCLFDLDAGLIFTDGFTDVPINNNQEYLKKHSLSILLIKSGNVICSMDNNELLEYRNKSIISKEGGKYYEYIIE